VKSLWPIQQQARIAGLASLEIVESPRLVPEFSYQADDFELLVMSKDRNRWDELVLSFGYLRQPKQLGLCAYRGTCDVRLPIGLIIVSDLTIDSKLTAFHDHARGWVWAANEACRIRTPLDEAYWERSLAGKNPEPFVM
jgi:hypothetical protein